MDRGHNNLRAIVELIMSKEAQRRATDVRRRYGRAAERRFWLGYYAGEILDAGPSVFIALIVVLLIRVAVG